MTGFPDGQAARETVSDLGVPAYVPGELDQDDLVRNWYAAADLLVLPAMVEPFGLVALEAMACGVPAVVSDAAGVAAVVAADAVTDWGNPNVVRASKGTVFSVPVASAPLEDVLTWLRARGIRLVATTPDTDELHTDVAYAGAVAIAVAVRAALEAADVSIAPFA